MHSIVSHFWSFATICIFLAASVNAQPVTQPAVLERFSARIEAAEQKYLKSDIDGYKQEMSRIFAEFEFSVPVGALEHELQRMIDLCLMAQDFQCVQTMTDVYTQGGFYLNTDLDQDLKTYLQYQHDMRKSYYLWLRDIMSKGVVFSEAHLADKTTLLAYSSDHLFRTKSNNLRAFSALALNDIAEFDRSLDRSFAALLSVENPATQKTDFLRMALNTMYAAASGGELTTSAAFYLELEELMLDAFPAGSYEFIYLSLLNKLLESFFPETYERPETLSPSFALNTFYKMWFADFSSWMGIASQLKANVAIECIEEGRIECFYKNLSETFGLVKDQPQYSRVPLDLFFIWYSNVGSVDVLPAAIRGDLESHLRALRSNPEEGFIAPEILSLVEMLMNDAPEQATLALTDLQLLVADSARRLDHPWRYVILPQALKALLSLTTPLIENVAGSNSAKLRLQLGAFEVLNHSLGSRDQIAAFWIAQAPNRADSLRRKQLYRVATKKKRFYMSAAAKFADKLSASAGNFEYLKGDIELINAFDGYASLEKRIDSKGSFYLDEMDQENIVQMLRSNMGEGEALVYSTLIGKTLHRLCVTNKDYKASSSVIDLDRLNLNRKLVELALTASHPPSAISDTQFPIAAAQEIHSALFDDLGSCYANSSSVTWIPSQDLSSLPLAALITKRDFEKETLAANDGLGLLPWAVKTRSFTRVTSIMSLLHGGSAVQKQDGLLAVGDPRLDDFNSAYKSVALRGLSNKNAVLSDLHELPNAAQELRQIKASYPGPVTLKLGYKATEREFRRSINGTVGTLTFATHGVVSGEIAGLEESALVLTPEDASDPTNDGLLTASEIADLTLGANFVSLSACNTAIYDRDLYSEEVQGLANAFLVSGVGTVMSTLWSVDTIIAEQINTSVYASSSFSDGDFSAALREAQLSVLSDESDISRQHPRFWAAFILVGKPSIYQHKQVSDSLEVLPIELAGGVEGGAIQVLFYDERRDRLILTYNAIKDGIGETQLVIYDPIKKEVVERVSLASGEILSEIISTEAGFIFVGVTRTQISAETWVFKPYVEKRDLSLAVVERVNVDLEIPDGASVSFALSGKNSDKLNWSWAPHDGSQQLHVATFSMQTGRVAASKYSYAHLNSPVTVHLMMTADGDELLISQSLQILPENHTFNFSPMGFVLDCDANRGMQVYSISEDLNWSDLAWIENATKAVALQSNGGTVVMGTKYINCKLGQNSNMATMWSLKDGAISEVFTSNFGPSVIGKPSSTNAALDDLYILGNTIELDVEDFKIPDGYRPKFSPHDRKASC